LEALPQSSSQMVFHAGTARSAETVTAVGGRVLAVTARADTLEEAHRLAYDMTRQIDWPEGFFRSDIGWRALK